MIPKFGKLLLLSVLMISLLRADTYAAQGKQSVGDITGPKIKDLYMVIIRDPDAGILAAEKGDIDILGDIARPVDIDRLSVNDGIELSLASGFHGFFLGFNMRRFPWNRKELRRAACMAIPRTKMVRDIFSGYAAPLSTFLPPASSYVANDAQVPGFDPDAARSLLSAAGWKWNDRGVLVPPGSDEPLKTTKLLSPTEQISPTTAEFAARIAESLKGIGIPVETDPMDFATMIARMDEHDFDSYVLAWEMSRDPDSLFAFYHSSMDVRGGYNIPGIHDAELDEALEELRYAPDEKSARKAALLSQEILADRIPAVPIYSRYYIASVSRKWKGTVKSDVSTPDNSWSLLKMEPADGRMSPLYWGLADEPRSLNPFSSSSAYDWQVMGEIYDTLITVDPYSMGDLPWLAVKWDIKTRDMDEKKRTVLTFDLRKDVSWQDGMKFSSQDVKATIMFLKDHNIPRYFDSVRNVLEVETPDEHTVRITMDGVSYWYLHNIGGLPILPGHLLENIGDWRTWQPASLTDPVDGSLTQLIGTGPFVFREYRRGEFVRLSRNDVFWLLGNRGEETGGDR